MSWRTPPWHRSAVGKDESVFLGKNRMHIGGKTHEYWTPCESVRTGRGPRQRVVASLGKLDDDCLRAGWDPIDALLDGRQPEPRQPDPPNENREAPLPSGTWELGDLSRIEVGRVREFGLVFIGLALWRRLGLHELLDPLIEPGREEVAWAAVAAVLTVGRFCGQASELGIAGSARPERFSWVGRACSICLHNSFVLRS